MGGITGWLPASAKSDS